MSVVVVEGVRELWVLAAPKSQARCQPQVLDDERRNGRNPHAHKHHTTHTAATMKGSSSGSGDVQKEEDRLQAIVLAGEFFCVYA